MVHINLLRVLKPTTEVTERCEIANIIMEMCGTYHVLIK
jgi:hypothetical protein